jgi:hypothetical protein
MQDEKFKLDGYIDLVASSALRKQAFNDLNIVQSAIAGFIGTFKRLV